MLLNHTTDAEDAEHTEGRCVGESLRVAVSLCVAMLPLFAVSLHVAMLLHVAWLLCVTACCCVDIHIAALHFESLVSLHVVSVGRGASRPSHSSASMGVAGSLCLHIDVLTCSCQLAPRGSLTQNVHTAWITRTGVPACIMLNFGFPPTHLPLFGVEVDGS